MKTQNYKKGFTLLFASLIGALVLSVGLAILSITVKQLALSAAGKSTQQSFYTADSATECALFLDRGGNAIDMSTSPITQYCYTGFFPEYDEATASYKSCVTAGTPPVSVDKIVCMGTKIVLNGVSGVPAVDTTKREVTSTFDFDLGKGDSGDTGATNNDMCFTVTVTKRADNPLTTPVTNPGNYDETATIIQTRGYNTCNTATINRYERAIRTEKN